MKIKTLDGIELDELLITFNEAFSDYFVPLKLTHDQLKAKIISDKINVAYSAGAFVDNKLVGFILHGFDVIDNKRVVYNGGTGVIPKQRGRGLTQQMYDFILPYLRAENIDHLILEVITKNIQAIKAYERVGFKKARALICYRGEINTIGNNEIIRKKLSEYDWERLNSFWDFSPSWQNSTRVLDELKSTNNSYGAFIDNQLVGYIVYNPLSKRVQQFATDKRYRRKKIASTLFKHICEEYDNNATIINVDKRSISTNQFLIKIGLQNFVEQLEMKLEMK